MTTKNSLKIEEYVIIVFFLFMLIILGIQIFSRYVFSFGFSWADQLSRIMFVWITFAGISLAAREGMHLKVTAFTLLFSDKIAKRIVIFGDVVSILFGFFMAYRIFLIMVDTIQSNQIFPVLWELPVWIMYLPGVLGMIGFSLRLIQTSIVPLFKSEVH